MPLTAAVRDALAWVVISGQMPKKIHLDTRFTVNEFMTFDVARHGSTGRFYFTTSETPEDYKAAPVWKSHTALIEAGFTFARVDGPRRRGQQWLRYLLEDETGTGWCAEVYRDGRVYFDRTERCKVVKSMVYKVSSKDAGTLPGVNWRAA